MRTEDLRREPSPAGLACGGLNWQATDTAWRFGTLGSLGSDIGSTFLPDKASRFVYECNAIDGVSIAEYARGCGHPFKRMCGKSMRRTSNGAAGPQTLTCHVSPCSPIPSPSDQVGYAFAFPSHPSPPLPAAVRSPVNRGRVVVFTRG